MTDPQNIDELSIRMWFMNAELSEALTTHAIVEGILSMRQQQKPQRKRRTDANKPRNKADQPPLVFDKGDRS